MKIAAHSVWFLQRVTALLLVFILPLILGTLFFHRHSTYEQWVLFLSNPAAFVPLVVFLFVTLWHAAIGIQVIIEDYVPNKRFSKALILSIYSIFGFLSLIVLISVIKL